MDRCTTHNVNINQIARVNFKENSHRQIQVSTIVYHRGLDIIVREVAGTYLNIFLVHTTTAGSASLKMWLLPMIAIAPIGDQSDCIAMLNIVCEKYRSIHTVQTLFSLHTGVNMRESRARDCRRPSQAAGDRALHYVDTLFTNSIKAISLTLPYFWNKITTVHQSLIVSVVK